MDKHLITNRGLETLILYSHFKNRKCLQYILGISSSRVRYLLLDNIVRLKSCGCGKNSFKPKQVFQAMACKKDVTLESTLEHFNSMIYEGLNHEDIIIKKCWQEAFNYYPVGPEGLLYFLNERYAPFFSLPVYKTASFLNEEHYIPNEINIDWKKYK